MLSSPELCRVRQEDGSSRPAWATVVLLFLRRKEKSSLFLRPLMRDKKL